MNLIGEYWGFYGIKAMSFRGVAKVSNDLRDLKVFKDFRDLPRKGRFRTFKIMIKFDRVHLFLCYLILKPPKT